MNFRHRLYTLIQVEPGELPALAGSFLYFFFVLSSYYILRPLREEMGVASGIENLQWLFTAVFAVMLMIVPCYGWVSSRFPRRKFVPWVYAFFTANIVFFFLIFTLTERTAWEGRIFFVWVSVFNLFVVSVFWSFMSDIFTTAQSKRLFGVIAAGGSAGAIIGPILTATLVGHIGINALLLVSAALLSGALVCIWQLLSWCRRYNVDAQSARLSGPIGGSVIAGATLVFQSRFLLLIALFTILATVSGSILYFQQAHIVSQAFDLPEQRTRMFALVDLAVNTLTVVIQIFFTSRIVNRLGINRSLLVLPILVLSGMLVLGFAPILGALVGVQVLRRATAFSLTVPTMNMLYTRVSSEERYKAKHFIDTVMYRFGDMTSGWLFTALTISGFGLSVIAFLGSVLGVVWIVVAVFLGRRFSRREVAETANRPY